MSLEARDEDVPDSSTKKRKLKHPRTAKACTFCRKRKVRCSGTQPCDYCKNEGVKCNYEDGLVRPPKTAAEAGARIFTPTHDGSSATVHETVAESQLIGLSSGVSMLYHLPGVNKVDQESELGSSSSLVTHGDIQQGVPVGAESFQMPNPIEVKELLDRYFGFAMPTYRFLHRPTLAQWADQLHDSREPLAGKSAAKSACVLLACAQSLLHTTPGNRYLNGGDTGIQRSRLFYIKARDILDHEPGPADLSSVQARLVMCLYLLSTFRMTECRFFFGFTHTVLTSLGLHRQPSSPDKLGLVELESRRRTFWCAYVLDGYLSVMLGRPRLYRHEDIDQPYPRNFDDDDLVSSESADSLPLHGNLEAFVGHIELAKLMAYNNDQLYPLKDLPEEQILSRTGTMIEMIESWKNSLPDFLKPREKTLTGERTFERQNTVLKLAHAHLSILATRRCLLLDTQRRGLPRVDDCAISGVRECVLHVSTVIHATEDLLQHGGLYQAYWFTLYVSLVAISTLYVFIIQDSKSSQYDQSLQRLVPEVDCRKLFEQAGRCQTHLANLAPAESQLHRHHRMLDQLRAKCDFEIAKMHERPTSTLQSGTRIPTGLINQRQYGMATNYDNGVQNNPRSSLVGPGSIGPSVDELLSLSQTHSDSFGWGWEEIDTLGFPTNVMFDNSFLVP